MTPDGNNSCAGNLSFDFGGIVNEVRFAEPHAQDLPPRQCRTQAPGDRLHLGKFRHGLARRLALLLHYSRLRTSESRSTPTDNARLSILFEFGFSYFEPF